MATAQELISSSLRLINVLASGETADASDVNDGLITLNQMLASWSLSRIMVPAVTTEQFAWPSATQSRTIGSGGNFSTVRPTKIETAFTRIGSIDYPLRIIGNDEYQNLALKSLSTAIPELLFYSAANPLGTLYLYPIPSAAVTLSLSSWGQLTSIAGISTVIAFSPGYERAIRYNLAVELSNEYGKSVRAEVATIATESMAAIKDINAPDFIMTMDPVFLDISQNNNNGRFNIHQGF